MGHEGSAASGECSGGNASMGGTKEGRRNRSIVRAGSPPPQLDGEVANTRQGQREQPWGAHRRAACIVCPLRHTRKIQAFGSPAARVAPVDDLGSVVIVHTHRAVDVGGCRGEETGPEDRGGVGVLSKFTTVGRCLHAASSSCTVPSRRLYSTCVPGANGAKFACRHCH